MLVWKGAVTGVEWPGRPQPSEWSFNIEMWSSTSKKHRLAALFPPHTTLQFRHIVPSVPLWTAWGPEFSVYSSHEPATEFFGQLAAAELTLVASIYPGSVALSGPPDSSKLPYIDHIVFYSVREEGSVRICARPLVLSLTDGPPNLESRLATPEPPSQSIPTPNITNPPNLVSRATPEPTVSASGPEASSGSGPKAGMGIYGPVKALQQTILGALRLRGIKRDDPEFKQLYHACFRAAEFALRKHTQPISLDIIREKVEALLTVFES